MHWLKRDASTFLFLLIFFFPLLPSSSALSNNLFSPSFPSASFFSLPSCDSDASLSSFTFFLKHHLFLLLLPFSLSLSRKFLFQFFPLSLFFRQFQRNINWSQETSLSFILSYSFSFLFSTSSGVVSFLPLTDAVSHYDSKIHPPSSSFMFLFLSSSLFPFNFQSLES